MFSKLRTVILTCLAVGIVVAACSSDGTQTPTATSPPATSVIPMATQAPPPMSTPTTTPAPTATKVVTPIPSTPPSRPPQSTQSPRPPQYQPPEQVHHMILREAFMIPSIDRQIFSADVIVLANFVSATAKTETTTTEGTCAYWPILTLNFTVVEYLKGTGPTNFSIDLRDDSKPHYWVNGVKTDRYPYPNKRLWKRRKNW